MHDTKIAISKAAHQKWCEGCLVISELDPRTIRVFDIDKLESQMMKKSAMVANAAIDKMCR